MKVRELMTDQPVTLDPDDRLVDAEEQMGLRGFRHVPVITGDGAIVGMLSDQDIVRATLAEAGTDHRAQMFAKAKICVRDVMATKLDTIGPDADIADAAAQLRQKRRSCFPVVEQGKLVGILTEADFVRLIADRGPTQG